jgi:cold shock protein
MTGSIKTWLDLKSFGFIRPDGGGADLFFHKSDLDPEAPEPKTGERVTFDPEDAPRGPRARNVTVID